MKASYQLLRAARAALGIENVHLADKAGVSKRTLVRIEALQSVSEASRASVQAALEAEGIEFLPSMIGVGPGLRISERVMVGPVVFQHEPGECS